MTRKDGVRNNETVRVRMSTDLLRRIQAAKEPSGWGEEADSSFARYLMVIGLQEAEAEIAAKNARYEAKVKKALNNGTDGQPAGIEPVKKASGGNP